MLQVLNFASFFLENSLKVLHFVVFFRDVKKFTKYSNGVKVTRINLSISTEKSYHNIKNMKLSAVFHISM